MPLTLTLKHFETFTVALHGPPIMGDYVKRKRLRLRLKPTHLCVTYDTRPSRYRQLRLWWLHELRVLRAKRRVNGLTIKRDVKAAQKELSKLRQEYS